jgi:hypothetical protein
MYDEKELFIENKFKRYSIGSTTDGLMKNKDGSIDLYIQKDNHGKDNNQTGCPHLPEVLILPCGCMEHKHRSWMALIICQ